MTTVWFFVYLNTDVDMPIGHEKRIVACIFCDFQDLSLYYESSVPDEYILNVGFNEGADVVEYKIPVLKLPEMSSQELSDRKMVILIPFHILKLRYAIEKKKFDNLDELQRYILNDIMAMTISLACKGEIVSWIMSGSS